MSKNKILYIMLLFFLFTLIITSCEMGGGGAKPVNNPPNTPSNPFPEDGATNMPLNLTLMWSCSDPDGDVVVYDLYFGTSQDNMELLASNITSNSYVLSNLVYSTTYYWKIVAKDDSGAQTDGPIWSFTTIPAPNYPPEFSYVYPPDESTDQPVNLILQWHATDPNGDEIKYDLYFGTTKYGLSLIKGNTKDEYYQFGIGENLNLNHNTTYYWKVVAKDGKGGQVDTGVMEFTTELEENKNPALTYNWPENGIQLSSYSVTLQWHATDPNGDAIRYDIYFGTSPNPPLFVSNHTGTSYIISDLLPNKTYYWRIVAKDERGGITYGETRYFYSPINNPPNPFNLHQPFNLYSSCSLIIPVRYVVLSWDEATDPDGDTVKYNVYFGDRTPPSLYKSGLRETQLVLTQGLEYNKTYYWKVVAVDDKGNERSSIIDSFTTYQNSPPVIYNISPADKSTVDRINLNLSWSVSDENNDRWKVVKVELGRRSDSLSTIFGESDWIESGRSYSVSLDLLPANTTYYWRITVVDEGGIEVQSATMSFTTSDR